MDSLLSGRRRPWPMMDDMGKERRPMQFSDCVTGMDPMLFGRPQPCKTQETRALGQYSFKYFFFVKEF